MSFAEIVEFLRMIDTELLYYINKFGVYIYILLFAIVSRSSSVIRSG